MRFSVVALAFAALALLGSFACSDGSEDGTGRIVDPVAAAPDASSAPARQADAAPAPTAEPDAGAATTPVPRPSFCDRAGDDPIRDIFCAERAPSLRSLQDLQERLGITPGAQSATGSYGFVVALAYSTALSGHAVSPINPRVLVLGRDTILAFQRGVQQIELASRRQNGVRFTFYLLTFEQACNASEHGCKPGDLFTPRVESDWTGISLRDDQDLANTPQDCRQCHQRGVEDPLLLMRELQSPWTHFFDAVPDDPPTDPIPGVRGYDLFADYVQAKGAEAYGGVSSDALKRTAPAVLQNTVNFKQPLLFDAPRIEDERWPYGPDGYASEPKPSPTWDRAYEAFKRGEQLAIPYYEARPTDPAKQAALSQAYARYRSGEISADDLPDLADIFPDDPLVRAKIGLQTEPGATPGEALIQACGSCHNDVLDQSLSRARFNIDLARLDAAEIAAAIERIELPRDAPGAMPPREARQLAPDARTRLLDYLRQDSRPTEFDDALHNAAELGMAGATKP